MGESLTPGFGPAPHLVDRLDVRPTPGWERFNPPAASEPQPVHTSGSSVFERCFEIVVGHEGGFVDHPSDPGGATKYGISQRSYPQVRIASLTLDDARAIYRRDYWDKMRCGELPAPLALLVFDAGVNSGPGTSVKWLQAAVGARQDGQIGPATLAAVATYAGRGAELCAKLLDRRIAFMASLPTWRAFGGGWSRRLIRLAFQSAAMRDAG